MTKREGKNDQGLVDVALRDQELLHLEQDVGSLLDEYDVEYPSEAEIMMTIDRLRPFVPVKVNKRELMFRNMAVLLKRALHEIFYISPLFWVANSLFFLVALAAVFLGEQNPYGMIMILAPIPTLTGLMEALKSRNTGMAELEMSFKYSLQEMILSKMVIIGGFNLLINLVISVSLTVFYHHIWLWKLLLFWITPFTVMTAIAFIIVNRLRHFYAITASLMIWISFGGLISQSHFIGKLESLSPVVYILITISAGLVIIGRITHMYKRGMTYELNP
ncbi:hypothetical protein JOD43_001124 [Pullulanibacillus pueri]|uniref:Uncharacterized protein n=1 Tax=Pullulanibacillus pueri TaxID=1437324 RepID=A0A8J2ZVF8_9BACL|nr:hypothetical protein [Pullulanibacillus pueri]MBM7680958.1 hypothetical protein [Pullulanibacillus pueri]GGH81490.1 hypothetical protein GCM10007096_19470 [Pullulanibacillus pueri]